MAGGDSDSGFQREEMFSQRLGGNEEPPNVHLFVPFKGAAEWEKRLEKMASSPVLVLLDLVKELNARQKTGFEINVTAVPESAALDDAAGDVLVFPHRVRVRGGVASDEAARALVAALVGNEEPAAGRAAVQALEGASSLDAEGGHIFVCTHAARDARCGQCGPKIMAAVERHLAGAPASEERVTVRECSHMGGHRFAGNGIVYRSDASGTCDWMGYLTDAPEDAEYLCDLATGAIQTPNPLSWRGRLGLTPAEHKAACAACSEGVDVEDLAAKAAAGAKPRVVFVLGPPGAGKGTQCAKMVEQYDMVHLSAGDLLRAERNDPESQNGELINSYIKDGKIVPVEITVKLLWAAMARCEPQPACFLVDGFPRNADNFQGWKQVVKNNAQVLGCFFFECEADVVVGRLLERGESSGRADDNAESIRKRMATYDESTMPIIRLFQARGKCFQIQSDRPVERVFEDVERVLSSTLGFAKKGDGKEKEKEKAKEADKAKEKEGEKEGEKEEEKEKLEHEVRRLQTPKVVFVLGGPGAGKGTQCDLLTQAFDMQHLSAGDLLRAERNDPESQNGELINSYIKDGKIVPVEITVQLLLQAMRSSSAPLYLIDGFPRNQDNFDGWKRVVGTKADVLGCLFLDCPETVMEARLLERGKTSGRADDNADSIRKRFHTYKNDTQPIIDLFTKQSRCFHVVSDRPVEAIFNEVSGVFSSRLGVEPLRTLPPSAFPSVPAPPHATPAPTASAAAVAAPVATFQKLATPAKLAIAATGAALVAIIGMNMLRRRD